jgi:hypothetical protein
MNPFHQKSNNSNDLSKSVNSFTPKEEMYSTIKYEVNSGKFISNSAMKEMDIYMKKGYHDDLKDKLKDFELQEQNKHIPFLKYFINLEMDQSKVTSNL